MFLPCFNKQSIIELLLRFQSCTISGITSDNSLVPLVLPYGNVSMGFGLAWTPDNKSSLSSWTSSSSCFLAFAQVTTRARTILYSGFTVDNLPLNNSVNRGHLSLLTSNLSAAAAVIFSDCPSTSKWTLARGYSTVSPCVHLIATALPGINLSSGTSFWCVRVLEQPVSSRILFTVVPSKIPVFVSPEAISQFFVGC